MNRRAPVRRSDETVASSDARRALLLALYRSALTAVDGRERTAAALADLPREPTAVIAVGKAAGAMMGAAQQVLGPLLATGIVVTAAGYEHGVLPGPQLTLCLGDHPVPGTRSLAAGAALADFLSQTSPALPVVVLLSGGASSLLEELLPGVTLEDVQSLNRWAHAGNVPIGVLNALRRRFSAMKGGRFAARLSGRRARAYVLSDVPGDDPSVVGSGLVAAPLHDDGVLPEDLPASLKARLQSLPSPAGARLPIVPVGSLQDALDAIEEAALALGLTVERLADRVDGPSSAAGDALAARLLRSPADILLGGGETTVSLPESPGVGGRCQHLALAVAMSLAGTPNVWFLAAGSDGKDGASEDAWALVDGGTVARAALAGLSAAASLAQADSGRFLEASGDLLHTGPTTTNVGDLYIGLKLADDRVVRCAA